MNAWVESSLAARGLSEQDRAAITASAAEQAALAPPLTADQVAQAARLLSGVVNEQRTTTAA